MENKEITLEQIDLVMERAKVSYTDAKEALEQANGDLLEALLYLEKNGKVSKEQTEGSDWAKKIEDIIHKLNKTRFKMFKEDYVYVNIPLLVALILIIPTLYISVIALLISLIMGIRIELEGDTDIAKKVNEEIEKIQK